MTTQSPAQKLHAYYAQQTIVTSETVERDGRAVTKARFADKQAAYQIDGGSWIDHWAVDAAFGAMFCDSEFSI